MTEKHEGPVRVDTEDDIVVVRKAVRDTAKALGFGVTDVTRIVTAASELTRNIIQYAGSGQMKWSRLNQNNRVGIEMIFEDSGPGIADIDLAMTMGYTSGGGMGMGLPGAKRLMDEFEISSEIGKGTKVLLRKWLKKGPLKESIEKRAEVLPAH
jgi:serine/threonine-protein kinase RsbT